MWALKRLVAVVLHLCCCPLITNGEETEFLNQNWTSEARQQFYTTSQGSRIMPYDWFLALEASDSQDSFAQKKLLELGYIENSNTDHNPDRLPVGFVLDENKITQEKFVGLNCAACHTNQIHFEGRVFQIDGAPALSDMWELLQGIDNSLQATLRNDDKFQRFSTKVLSVATTNGSNPADLKRDLRKFSSDWKQFVQDSTVAHPWGRGRLDAFGMIFNRVSSINIGIPENSSKPDAPVSIPFLWGTSFQDRVQWNGSAENSNDIERLGRNVGEVLGVFAQAQFRATPMLEIPIPARTSAKRLNQVRLENQLKQLWSPEWPTAFGDFDNTQLRAGKVLYDRHCVSCHTVVPHGLQNTPVEVSMTALSEVQTDPRAAVNAASGTVSTGSLRSFFDGKAEVPRGVMLKKFVQLSLISPYRDIGKGNLLERLSTDDLFQPNEISAFLREIGVGQKLAMAFVDADKEKISSYYEKLQQSMASMTSTQRSAMVAADAPSTLEYKAAPLAGIWATAPYLHNGSVPNLYELLLPAAQRSKRFLVGSRQFDPKKVGFRTEFEEVSTLLDTALPGNSNSGHDMYGVFSESERWDLIEYLKSL